MNKVTRSIVINAANHLKWSNRIGIIKKGYWADIIAVEGDLGKGYKCIAEYTVYDEGRESIYK